MDVKRASAAIDEILECVTEVANSGSTLYSKSKQRLQHIAQACSSITSSISSILGEALNAESNDANIASELASLKNDVEMLKAAMNSMSNCNENIPSDSTVVCDSPDCEQPVSVNIEPVEEPTKLVASKEKLSPESMKQIVAQYGHVLKLASVTDQLTVATNECAGVIWRWFDKRIYTKYPNAPPFHYGAHRLKSIIQAIVLTYSYHFEHSSVDVFLRYFEDWLDSLSQSTDSNKWIAPYTVYSVERKLTKEYATLTAVVIWDILIATGLHGLCDNNNEYMLHENDMWDLVASVNIDALDSYVDYRDDPSILESLNTSYTATNL